MYIYMIEAYSKTQYSKHLSYKHVFYLKLSKTRCFVSIGFNLCLEYAILKVQGNQGRLKSNGTHHLLVSANSINIMGYYVNATKETRKLQLMPVTRMVLNYT